MESFYKAWAILISIFLLVTIGLLSMSVQEKKELEEQLSNIKAVSESKLKDKQHEVDTTHERANTFIEKAKKDYETKVASIKPRTVIKRVFQQAANDSDGNAVRSFQEPAGVVESPKENAELTACQNGYNELWETWHGLCLIYGCVD